MKGLLVALGLLFSINSTETFGASAGERWSCVKTSNYAIYEEIERSGGKSEKTPKTLEWIDEDTFIFEVFTHKRTSPKSTTFVKDTKGGTSVYVKENEFPYLVILTEPQTFGKIVGHLRVAFYRCSP
jgi:hypothetical protein